MATRFVDDGGVTRFDGVLETPGATPGDVLTVQPDGTVEPAAGGGSQPFVQRAPVGDITVPDGGCIVVVDYYTPTGTLTLEGDAALEILT